MKPSKLMSSMLALLPVGHKPCFFLRELFLRGYLQTFELTYSGTISPILYLSPWKLTKSIKAEWPLTLWDLQVPVSPDVQQLLTPVTARITGHSPLACAITTVHGLLRQRSAELPAPGRETSSLAGGCSYPTCRAFYLISSNLFSRFQEFKKVPHRFWSLSIGFFWSRILRRRFWSKTVNRSKTVPLSHVQVLGLFLYSSGTTS